MSRTKEFPKGRREGLVAASEEFSLNKKRQVDGYKIVLTADRTLMSEYHGGIFLGFSACVPRGLIPDRLYFSLLCPSVPVSKNGSVKYAPCGTRRIEASLLNAGFNRDEVVVAHPEHLGKVLGVNTRILCITETDPLGMGPATSTFTQLFGGEAYMAVKFKEILKNPFVQKYKPKIVVGGAGAWQLEDQETREVLGIDCAVIGEGEAAVSTIFKVANLNEPLPEVIYPQPVEEPEIQAIQGGTIAGVVEIARGCGRGCAFCQTNLQRYRCLSIETILKDVDVNLEYGRQPLLHAEDVLRYEADGVAINKPAVKELFEKVYHHPGVKTVAVSHIALASVASAPDIIDVLSDILEVGRSGEWMSAQCGIETGSPKLIKNLMAGKASPFTPKQWPAIVEEAFSVLNENNWVPVATLIIGMPGEEEDDVRLTIDLITELRRYKSLITPLFLVEEGGLKGKAKSFRIERIDRCQGELFLKCWEHSLNWGEVLLKEFPTTRNAKGFGLRHMFSYGIDQAKKLVRTCQEDYECDIMAMVTDIREGKHSVVPRSIRLIKQIANVL